jgi:hypothetical protein
MGSHERAARTLGAQGAGRVAAADEHRFRGFARDRGDSAISYPEPGGFHACHDPRCDLDANPFSFSRSFSESHEHYPTSGTYRHAHVRGALPHTHYADVFTVADTGAAANLGTSSSADSDPRPAS